MFYLIGGAARTVWRSSALVLALVVAAPCSAAQVNPTITVNATGSSAAAPDMAVMSMAVMSEATTAREALDKNNQSMAAVVKAMKAAGIAARDLQTSGFSIQPRMSYPKRTGPDRVPKVVGYTVNNTLTVRVRKLNQVGQLLDQAVTLGVNQGGSINFTNDKPDAILSKARAAAMKNAIAKAQTLVQAAGVRLGKITKITENSRRPRSMPMASMRTMSAAAPEAVPVEAGENNYTVTVSVSWEIDQ